ncbi:MAG TPA: Ig-like domain-containing protein [candidate division Zixibacteria bacterium]|nr:Ig-like domain-containing protein [candidate division Zixibacteria bacterium]
MLKLKMKTLGIILITISLTGIFYYPEIEGNELTNTTETDLINQVTPMGPGPGGDKRDLTENEVLNTTKIEGNYKTQAYFLQNNFIDISEDGYVFEWEKYEDIKDYASDFYTLDFRQSYQTFYPPVETYATMPSQNLVNYEHIDSTVFSPVFEYNTTLQGKIIFLVWADVLPSSQSHYTLKITLELFNTTDNTATEFASTENFIDDDDWTFKVTLDEPVEIPAGFRIRMKYEAKRSATTADGEVELHTGSYYSGAEVNWIINDINSSFVNTYTIPDIRFALGLQLYMYEDKYPTININGFTNNTIYYQATSATLTIEDSILNRYKWEYFSGFEIFNSPKTIYLNESMGGGWHTLTVEAYDDFDNYVTAYLILGYDVNSEDIILNNPANNSLITDGQTLDFTVFDVIGNPSCKFDKSGPSYSLEAPNYDLSYYITGFTGWHNLTVYSTSDFGNEETVFWFEFDNSAPTITLDNVNDGDPLPPQKNIDVLIEDRCEEIDVFYFWEGDSTNTTLNPIEGDLYRIVFPSAGGTQNLTIYANDTFGQLNKEQYSFVTDADAILIDLNNLVDGSYYLGGNTINITVRNYLGDIYYFWGNDIPINATDFIINDYLILSGLIGIPTSPGTYYLTINATDLLGTIHLTQFLFYVDQEKPQVLPVDTYLNDTRYLKSKILSFDFDDNLTSASNLDVRYSIDGLANQTIINPENTFNFFLNTLSEGNHNLTIYISDIAGNNYSYFIKFVIDISAPVISIDNIEGSASAGASIYIPAFSEVTCSFLDDDPTYFSYYSWDGSTYTLFSDTFILPDSEGEANLLIYSNDTLGNFAIESINLIIDNTAPTISINLLENESKINADTILRFSVSDLNDETVDSVASIWIGLETVNTTRTSVFTASLLYDHQFLYETIIEINATDIVDNRYSIRYKFYLDFEAPTYFLNIANNSYVRGNSLIDFSITCSDLEIFNYRWDSDTEFEILNDPYDIVVPSLDGSHTLYIHLEDDTGGGFYPNIVEAIYVFIVDDIEISYITPSGFSDNYHHIMIYEETFTFTLDIKDTVNDLEINGLVINWIEEDEDLNLLIDYDSLTATIYEFTITATNVTEDYKYIEFQFWQFTNHKQSLFVYFQINKKEGNVAITDSDDSVVYGQNATISFQLKDSLNVDNLEVTFLRINTNYQDIYYTLIDSDNLIYELTFNTADFVTRKGDFTFEFYVESSYYFGVMNDTTAISMTILPISITLTIEVSNTQIIYDNDLVIYATLLQADGTPIQFVDLTFIIYINYTSLATTNDYPYSFDDTINSTSTTNAEGLATLSFKLTEEMESITVSVLYEGNDIYDPLNTSYQGSILAIPPSGLPLKILIIIIVSAIVVSVVIGFVVYRLVRARPFEELLEKVSEEEIIGSMEKLSPGVILTLFDQTKGPIPLVGNHSLDSPGYRSRMRIGTENFLLKIADQAYSSLGFEEHDERRRIGSINLPNEDMVGFIHGIQLENKAARGGFENLSLIVLAESDVGGLMLANQEFMFKEIDDLIVSLKEKEPLVNVEEHLSIIRKRSVRIMITAERNTKKDKKEIESYQ